MILGETPKHLKASAKSAMERSGKVIWRYRPGICPDSFEATVYEGAEQYSDTSPIRTDADVNRALNRIFRRMQQQKRPDAEEELVDFMQKVAPLC